MDCLFVLISYNESVRMSTKIIQKNNKNDKKLKYYKKNAQKHTKGERKGVSRKML